MRSIAIAIALALMATLAFSGLVAAGGQRPMKGQFTIALVGTDLCGTDALR